MRKKIGTLLATLILLLAIVIPVAAITNGEPDNGRHPFVGLMVADDAEGNPLWRCSGTLISETVFLTAGHCTEAPAARATIWFAEDVEATPGFGTPAGYPYEGDVDGTVYTHPQYDPYAFYLYDLGVVVLDEAITDRVTAVGYGLQEINPNRYTGERDRLLATLDLINTKGVFGVPRGTAIKVSGSGVGGDSSDSGGTCFGDSGGPQFLADTHIIAAVTSFGLNGNCAGVGGGYRVDQPDDLEWLAEVLSW
jgi:hypothetical protein